MYESLQVKYEGAIDVDSRVADQNTYPGTPLAYAETLVDIVDKRDCLVIELILLDGHRHNCVIPPVL